MAAPLWLHRRPGHHANQCEEEDKEEEQGEEAEEEEEAAPKRPDEVLG